MPRIRPLLPLLIVLAACDIAPRGPMVRRARNPAERSLAELRPKYAERIVACELPAATPAADDIELVTPDGALRIAVPTGWDPAPAVDTAIELSDTTITARWSDGARARLSVRHMRFGNQGPAWIERSSPPLTALPTCEVSADDAGAIWRRYDPTDSTGYRLRFPFSAYGEVITNDSLRYRIDASAATAYDRDLLLRRISDAAIGGLRAGASVEQF